MRNVDWAIAGTASVLLAGVGASLVTIVSLTWTPDLAALTEVYLGDRAGGTHDAEAPQGASPPAVMLEQHRTTTGQEVEERGLLARRTEAKRTDGTLPEAKRTPRSEGVHAEQQTDSSGLRSASELGGIKGLVGGGAGLGGGGIAQGFGGLGTRGVGIGSSGYGSGGGSLGSAGRGSVGVGGGTFGASGGLSRSELGPGVVGTTTPSAHGQRINGFVQADRDRLSTFAVDVDTGSYTLARGLLRRGALPRHEQVRVEEFVNAMDYDLAPPTSGRVPFAVASEAAPHPTAASHALLRIALKGEIPEPDARANRLTFLVDTSCSMTDDLALVKTSLHTLVDHAGPEDSIAIATYAGGSSVVLEPTPTTRRDRIHAAIEGLTNGGGTAMGSGMELAYDMADRAYVAGAENRVIVLSDGDANIGPTSHEQILQGIEAYAGRGITMSAVGFGGANYRDGLMEQLADKGDGNYVYIDGPREAQRVFGEGVAATLTTIARDVKIQVAFDSDAVLAWRLVGYENRDVADEDFRNDAVDGGEIGAGHEVTALYEVVLADALPDRIGHIYMRAKPPGPDAAAHEWTVPIRSAQIRSRWADASNDLRLAASAALFAEKLRASPYVEELAWADLQELAQPLPATEQVVQLRELIARAETLSEGQPGGPAEAGLVPPAAQTPVSMEVVRRHMHRLRYCYQRRLVQDPRLSGTIDLELDIDPRGLVAAARTHDGTLADATVASCLKGQARRLRFPANQPHNLRFTLTFAP